MVLSVLLGEHPPEMRVADIVAVAGRFGVTEPTVRVALTRMVSGGDLERTDHGYRLADRLIERQRRQDEAIRPDTRPWNGEWEMAVITASGRGAAERATLRSDLTRLRMAERREGVWLRPDNLQRPWPGRLHPVVERYTAHPAGDPRSLAHELWDLTGWVDTGRNLLKLLQNFERPADGLAAAAAIVRHVSTDPVLPGELLPDAWPGDELRAAYATYQRSQSWRA